MSVAAFVFRIDDLDLVLSLYDRIQVWRSATQNGTYVEITDETDKPAIIDGTVEGPWALNGKTLTASLSGSDPISVVFAGTDPMPLDRVIHQINAVTPGFALEVPTSTGKLRLSSPLTGTAASVVLSGNAVSVLGLSTAKSNGKSRRIALSPTTKEYQFRDFDGSPTLWYKIRYSSSVIPVTSSFLPPQQSNPTTVVPGGSLVTASVSLADATGAPIVGRRIIFVPLTAQKDSGSAYGILPGFDRITLTTDSSGKASTPILKGARVKVFFEGSNFNREFTVPDADFDVITVAGAEPDPLNIVEAPPSPIRMS